MAPLQNVGLALAMLALVSLAGCEGRGQLGARPATQGDSFSVQVMELRPIFLRVDVGIGIQGQVPASAMQPAQNGGPLEIPANASSLIVEARWVCDTAPCRFRANLIDAAGRTVDDVVGDGQATILVRHGAAGGSRWAIGLFTDGAAVRMRGEIRATAFAGPIPEGYSAF